MLKKSLFILLVGLSFETRGAYYYLTSYVPMAANPTWCSTAKNWTPAALAYMYWILNDSESIWYKDGVTGKAVVGGFKECLENLAETARSFDAAKPVATGAQKYLLDVNKKLVGTGKKSGIGQIVAAVADYIIAWDDRVPDVERFQQITLSNGKKMNTPQAVSFFVKLFKDDGSLKTSSELAKIYNETFGSGVLSGAASSVARAARGAWKEGETYYPPSIKKAIEAEELAQQRSRSPSPTRAAAATASRKARADREKRRDDLRTKYNIKK
jgi:hypothetical protein